jgi:two-component system, OmpR family, alkaline phosphatase synthesis response regulator PhoP
MEKKGVVAFGEIVVDFDRMELHRRSQLIPATSLEIRLLKFFVENPGYVFSREELIRAVWPERKRVNGRTVDNSISRLRRKIEENPARPVYFQTLYGAGYKFCAVRL